MVGKREAGDDNGSGDSECEADGLCDSWVAHFLMDMCHRDYSHAQEGHGKAAAVEPRPFSIASYGVPLDCHKKEMKVKGLTIALAVPTLPRSCLHMPPRDPRRHC